MCKNEWCVKWKTFDLDTLLISNCQKIFKSKQQASRFIKSILMADSSAMNIHMHTSDY